MRVSAEEREGQLIAATVKLMRREGVGDHEGHGSLCFSNKEELMDAAAEAWLKNLSRFSGNVPVHLGLRRAVEQVAEGYWPALEEDLQAYLLRSNSFCGQHAMPRSVRWLGKFTLPM